MPHHLADRVFRCELAVANEIRDLFVELWILKDGKVHLEDVGHLVRFIEFFPQLVAELYNLVARLFERLLKTLDLMRQLVRHKELARNSGALAFHHESRSYRYPRTHCNAALGFHLILPRRSCS